MAKYEVVYQVYVLHDYISEVEANSPQEAVEMVMAKVKDGSVEVDYCVDYHEINPNCNVYDEDGDCLGSYSEDELPF